MASKAVPVMIGQRYVSDTGRDGASLHHFDIIVRRELILKGNSFIMTGRPLCVGNQLKPQGESVADGVVLHAKGGNEVLLESLCSSPALKARPEGRSPRVSSHGACVA